MKYHLLQTPAAFHAWSFKDPKCNFHVPIYIMENYAAMNNLNIIN